jgi:hypothetical protein
MPSRTPSGATKSQPDNCTPSDELRIHDVKEMFAATKDHA